jgi:hypothetical protein
MGTNYYWHERHACPTCDRPFEALHIGKSSGGWCFSLHVYPDDGIRDLPDWEERFARAGSWIDDEYGSPVTAAEMRRTIADRGRPEWPSGSTFDYASNGAEPGPKNLVRHRIGRHCVGHGAGTWDLIIGDFS